MRSSETFNKKDQEFQEKVVIITGGSRGIGAATAIAFAEHGAKGILLTSRTNKDKTATDLVERINTTTTTKASWIPTDIANKETPQILLEKALLEYGHVDILVNNAGTRRDKLLIQMTDQDIEEVIQTNLVGTMLLTKAVIWQMIRQKRSGAIVFISSMAAEGNAGQSNYSASKGGINSFAKSIALEYRKRNIRANVLAPGLAHTELIANLTENQIKELLASTGAETILTPKEVALHVLFLASEYSRHTSGYVIPLVKSWFT